ncbi:MAG: hypothetical protein HY321_01840 [Armatimonadetes bacterium]|nr:hypothetical protein [Armatimonadota bacterium]
MDLSFYIYAGIGLFGFLYILVTFFLGELGHLGDFGGVDMDHDMDAGLEHEVGDAGADHSADVGESDAPGPFSSRVISIFLTAFGAVAAGARYSGLPSSISAGLGMAAGYGLGWLTYRFMRLVWAQGASSHVRTRDLEGALAEVSVAIPVSGPGQVACIASGTRTYQIARAAAGTEIPLGSRVRIVSVTPEGVVVEPAPEDEPPASGEFRRRMHHA